MATAFKTLGAGNGFSYCLSPYAFGSLSHVSSDYSFGTLENAANQFWNVEHLDFGSNLSISSVTEPKDLICDSNIRGSGGPDGLGYVEDFDSYTVDADTTVDLYSFISDIKPQYHSDSQGGFIDDEYKLGISFYWSANSTRREYDGGGQLIAVLNATRVVHYYSGYASLATSPFSPTYSSVSIGGLPFLKETYTTSDTGAYIPPDNSPNPAITFHTY